MSSKKRRNKKRSHTNKYADKVNIDYKKKKQLLSESVMFEHDIDEVHITDNSMESVIKDNPKKEPVDTKIVEINTVAETTVIEQDKKELNKKSCNKHKDGYYKNVSRVISEKKERYKEMGVSQRVKRGMVFWYDVDPNRQKDYEHTVTVRDAVYHDYIIYGNRPWVVVSCEENNKKEQMVTIVPMSTGRAFTSRYDFSHVDIFFAGKDTCVMCEQIRTVNAIELRDYVSTLSDEVMDKIEDAIMFHVGITNKVKFTDCDTKTAFDKIEGIIEDIIKSKLDEVVTSKATQTDINNAVTRIGDLLEDMFKDKISGNKTVNNKNEVKRKSVSINVNEGKENSQVDKFFKKYPNEKKDKDRPIISIVPKKSQIKSETIKTEIKKSVPKKVEVSAGKAIGDRWDKEKAEEFVKDFDTMDTEQIMNKWGYATKKTCLNMKYYLQKKFEI